MKARSLFAFVGALFVAGSLAAQQSTITDTARELNRSFDADIQQWTERFEHEGRAIYDRRYEILDELALRPGMAVADIGAGSGLISRLIAQRVGPQGTVYAVDIAKNMVDHIAKTAAEQGLPQVKAVLGDPKSPKLAPGSVDRICIIDAYHHFEYPREMLAEIKKALRPDGMLLLVDFKRIDGVSRPYILKMVRAGQGTFTDEFQNAGFELVERNEEMFPENYLLKFRHRKPAPPAPTGQP
jgi:cyclopropane fatty-acyl-phospholipid synthase-like methyltransferase